MRDVERPQGDHAKQNPAVDVKESGILTLVANGNAKKSPGGVGATYPKANADLCCWFTDALEEGAGTRWGRRSPLA